MARYDVYPNPEGGGFVLDVQTDLIDGFDTRVVVPLVKQTPRLLLIPRLNPVFEIDGAPYVMATHLLLALPQTILRNRRANLAARHDDIIAALDMIVHGF